MIDLALLGILKEHDLHGYELRKRLGELTGMRLAVSFGSLYPALGRLERAGLVKTVSHRTAHTPSAPMSGSLAGELAALRAQRRAASASRGTRGARGKKVYGITAEGEQRLHELLTDPDVSDDRTFRLRVAFCRQVTPAERIELFERRRAELTRRRDQRRPPSGPDGRLNTYLRSLVERDTEAIAADVAWLERLIEAERTNASPADADEPTVTGADHNSGGHP